MLHENLCAIAACAPAANGLRASGEPLARRRWPGARAANALRYSLMNRFIQAGIAAIGRSLDRAP